jgi:hypothetical protein
MITRLSDGRLHPFFRYIGFVLGPLFILVGIGMIYLGCRGGFNVGILATGLGGSSLGVLILRASLSGRDPYRP